MRAEYLKLTAFGPFATSYEVDFSALSKHGLFLIHGPTGSGKSSILDGICYACFGVCSDGIREGRYVRCAQAAASLKTEIDFEFLLINTKYRVWRSPEQLRAKKRGEGFTKVRPEASLWKEVDGEWTLMAAQWHKVTEAIETLLGLRSDQFRQVMMLPQGQFRSLLLSDSKDRQAIFEALFHTEIYCRYEAMFRTEARTLTDKLDSLTRDKAFILNQCALDDASDLNKKVLNLHSIIQNSQYSLQEMRAVETQILHKYEIEKKAEQAWIEREGLLKKMHQLLEDKESIEIDKQRLNNAEKALILQKSEELISKKEKLFNAEKKGEESSQKSLLQCQQDLTCAENAWNHELSLQEEKQELEKELHHLEALEQQAKDLKVIKKKYQSKLNYFTLEKVKLDEAVQQYSGLKKEIDFLLEAQINGCQAESKLSQLLGEQATLDKQETQLKQWKQYNTHYKLALQEQHSLQKRLEIKIKGKEAIAQELVKAELTHLNALATTLSHTLKDNSPCPVCGSKIHPLPANSELDTPYEQEIKKKQEELQAQEEGIEADQLQLQTVQNTLNTSLALSQALVLDVSEKKLLLQKKTLLRHVSEMRESLKSHKKTIEILAVKKGQLSKLEQEQNALQASFSQKEMELTQSKTYLDTLQNQIPDQFEKKLSCLKKQVKDTQLKKENITQQLSESKEKYLKALGKSQAQSQVVLTLNTELETLKSDLKSSLESLDLTHTFAQGKKDIPLIVQLKQRVHSHQVSLDSTKERLHSLKRLAPYKKPELSFFESTLKLVKYTIEVSIATTASLTEQYKILKSQLVQLDSCQKELSSLEESFSLIAQLSDLANGRNSKGLTFHRYILSSILDDVLIVASDRLRKMSRQRYELHRQVERKDKRSASGLDLLVYDSYSSEHRPVNTLSGGESFLAALALALGLADVVQNYSGGLRLDTLFIDEGFGSLDSEALDLALNAIEDLKGEGRLIGLISHVSELKERIHAKIELAPTSFVSDFWEKQKSLDH